MQILIATRDFAGFFLLESVASFTSLIINSFRFFGTYHTRSAVFRAAQVHTNERIYIPCIEEPLSLEVGSVEYRSFNQLRDEAHRFALKHHRKKRSKQSIASI